MERHQPYEKLISVCTNFREEGDCCAKRGGKEIADALKERVKKAGLNRKIRVSRSGCLGLCDQGPNIAVYPDGGPGGTWYRRVGPEDVPVIIDKHVSPSPSGSA